MKLKHTIGALTLVSVMLSPFGKSLVAANTNASTDIIVRLPDIIILHYISTITLDFGADIAETGNEGAGSWDTDWDGTVSTGGSELESGNLDLTTSNLDVLGTLDDVTITNVWAIRGLSSNGEATVSISNTSPILTNSIDNISLSDFKVSTAGVSASDSITAPLNGLSRSSATIGNVLLDIDLSDAETSGDYEAANPEYTITAEAV